MAGKRITETTQAVRSKKNRILLLINNEKFSSLIKDSEFITEQSLVYKEEIKIIDLLLFKDNNYYIIDYKTTKEKSAEHIVQVTHYKKAIKDIFKTQNVFSYLIYLHPTQLQRLHCRMLDHLNNLSLTQQF